MPAPAHPHRTPQPCPICHDWPDFAWHLAAALNHLEEHIDTLIEPIAKELRAQGRTLTTLKHQGEQIMSNQDELNTRVAALSKDVQDAVDAIKNQPGAEVLDFSALDAAIATLDEATPDVPPPVEPTP